MYVEDVKDVKDRSHTQILCMSKHVEDVEDRQIHLRAGCMSKMGKEHTILAHNFLNT